MLSLAEIEAAADLVHEVMIPTPAHCWPLLSERVGAENGNVTAALAQAAKTFEARPSASDVRYPPYDSPQIPTRMPSTSGRDCRYLPAASTSSYSAAPAEPACSGN